MFSNKLNYKIINAVAFLSLIYITVSNIGIWWGIFTNIVVVLLPFIVGFFLAYALTPLVDFLCDKNIKRGLSVTIVIVGIVLLIGALLAIVLPLVYEQLTLFIKVVAKVLENFGTKFNVNLGGFEIKVTDYLNDILKDMGNFISSSTVGFVSGSINFISKFIVGFVGFIYFLADFSNIRSWLKEILQSFSNKTYKYFKCLNVEISNYLKGLGIFMIIQLIEYSLLFFIVGHPNWLLLGILACVTTVIPYFGGLITNVIAIITASVISKPLVIATVVICLIFPQLDGYLISPKVYGKTNDVNPLITIMAVSIGGTVAGIWGIIIALPCYLFIRTTYNFFKKDLKKGVGFVKKSI